MNHGKPHELRILTPDGVVFSLALAGPGVRALALFIDFLVVQAAIMGVYRVAIAVSPLLPDFSGGFFVLLQFALQIGYGMTMEFFWGGRTIGKRLFGLRVADERGLTLQPAQIAIRNLMRAIDMLPGFYLVGGLSAFFNRHAQRLGDLAAGTVVIRSSTPPSWQPPPENIGKFNSFRAHPAMEARLRQRTDPAEAALLARALSRRDALEPDARLGVFADLAARFRSKVRFPEEATHSLTDEQFLRNCADTLFRSARRRPPHKS